MSDYHVLAADEFANTYQVVFHVPVPDTTNAVGYNYRTALVEYQGGSASINSRVPFIDGAELTQLQNGELYEVSRQYYSNPSQLLADKRDELDAMFPTIVSQVQANFQDVLGFWGYSRDIP